METQREFIDIPNENRLSVRMPIEKKIKFLRICNEHNMKPAEAICMLIDFYSMENTSDIRQVRNNIVGAVEQGITQTYIGQLKLLYEYLVIFLKRINELH